MPSVDEVQRIVAIESPVVRNLEITYCYSRLAAASATRIGEGANWCTYATWASRQAGGTIRGEDLLAQLERMLGEGRWLLHPVESLWRRLLRRGLFERETRLGRLADELHTPFDAFERASDAVARGNLKVFEEIGLQFARYLETGEPAGLRPGDPPEGQRLLSQAFAHYEQARLENDPGPARPARPAREPGDRPARADAPAAGDPRGARCRDDLTGGPGPASARRAVSGREALVAERPRVGGRRDRHAGASHPASGEQAVARSDHGRADGAVAAGTRAGARREPRRRVSEGAGRARRPGPRSRCWLASSRFRPPSTTAARATGRTSTSGCTTSSICFGCSI